MTRLIAFPTGLALSAVLAGCNTVSGVGEDVAATGRGISNASRFVQEDLLGIRPPPPPPPQAAPDALSAPARVTVGPACDPDAGELAGGADLPACDTGRMRAQVIRPANSGG